MNKIGNVLICCLWFTFACNTVDKQEVTEKLPAPLKYRNPGLTVDLGVGLWAWPLPMDWDGDQDLICGNSAGYIGFFENLDGGSPPRWNQPVYLKAEGEVIRIMAGENGSVQGPAEKKWGYTTLSVADWDEDSLQDIIVNSIWGKVVWYRNTGERGSPRLSKARPILVEFEGATPKPAWNWWNPVAGELVTQWRTTPFAVDWNRDGLNDLVMLDTEGTLSLYERFREDGALKLSPAQSIFYGKNHSVFNHNNRVVDSTAGPLRLNIGEAGGSGRRKFCFADWDHTGMPDLLMGAEDGHLYYYKNNQ